MLDNAVRPPRLPGLSFTCRVWDCHGGPSLLGPQSALVTPGTARWSLPPWGTTGSSTQPSKAPERMARPLKPQGPQCHPGIAGRRITEPICSGVSILPLTAHTPILANGAPPYFGCCKPAKISYQIFVLPTGHLTHLSASPTMFLFCVNKRFTVTVTVSDLCSIHSPRFV